jgi:hypothetical protein
MMSKAKPLPDINMLCKIIKYDPIHGVFIWIESRPRCKKGGIAGSLNKDGYLYICINGIRYSAQRLAWFIFYKEDPGAKQVDHINGDKLDNVIENLRLATQAENIRNRTHHKRSKLKIKGVSYDLLKQKYVARICINYKSIFLGYFPTPELAHMAYCKAAAELHGEFARGA